MQRFCKRESETVATSKFSPAWALVIYNGYRFPASDNRCSVINDEQLSPVAAIADPLWPVVGRNVSEVVHLNCSHSVHEHISRVPPPQLPFLAVAGDSCSHKEYSCLGCTGGISRDNTLSNRIR